MLQPDESLMNASEYICDTYVNEPYRELLRMIALIALLAVGIIISLIAAITAGRNEKMGALALQGIFSEAYSAFSKVRPLFLALPLLSAYRLFSAQTGSLCSATQQ